MTNYKAVTTATKTLVFTSVNASAPMSDTTIVTSTYTSDDVSTTTAAHTLMAKTRTSASTPIITQGFIIILKIFVFINILFILVL